MNKMLFGIAAAVMAVQVWASAPLVFTGLRTQGALMRAPGGAEQSFSCWFKATGMGQGSKPYDRIIQGNGWYLHTHAAEDAVKGFIFGYTNADGSNGNVRVNGGALFNVWQHFAVTYSASSGWRIYVNGWDATGFGHDVSVPTSLKGGLVCVGNAAPGGDRPFKGEIADAQFCKRVLSAEEVLRMAVKDPEGKPIRRPNSAGPKPEDLVPVVDISGWTNRHAIVAAGTESVYQGHPTTLLAPDGRTMFCVWTIGHGGPCGQMARSDDGGRSWVRLDALLPPEYKHHRNCPVLQPVPRPDGSGVNYCVFSANCLKGTGGGLGILMSRDNGRSWRIMPPAPHLSAGMPPTGFLPLKDGTCALFGQVRKGKNVKTDRPTDDQAVWMSVTRDGGATWDQPRIVAQKDKKNLCEPFALRSPDGKEICLLMRENRHTSKSMMCFSRDEGKTWTEPVDTCWGLTGDRHEGVMLPDGRYIIAFRDRACGSPTYGQYMAWVGTYDDIRGARPGQYRIHLLKHYPSKEYGWSKIDTGYSGVELLPDGTIVCTTYSKHWPGERKSSVVSTRFKISEIDDAAASRLRTGQKPHGPAPYLRHDLHGQHSPLARLSLCSR